MYGFRKIELAPSSLRIVAYGDGSLFRTDRLRQRCCLFFLFGNWLFQPFRLRIVELFEFRLFKLLWLWIIEFVRFRLLQFVRFRIVKLVRLWFVRFFGLFGFRLLWLRFVRLIGLVGFLRGRFFGTDQLYG